MTKKRKRRIGLRMVGQNRPLNELPESHVARRTVIAHAICCRDCVGQEIAWPGHAEEAFDQQWHSEFLQRDYTFSGFAYAFISFNLVMEEWITHPPHVTERENKRLVAIPLLQTLIDECETAAKRDENLQVMQCTAQIREFLSLWEESIRRRITQDGLPLPKLKNPTNPRRTLHPDSPGWS